MVSQSRDNFKFHYFLLIALLSINSASCSTLGRFLFEEPKAEISSIQMKHLSLDNLTIGIEIQVQNPNSFSIGLEAVDYSLSVLGVGLGEGRLKEAVSVEGGASKKILLPFKLKPLNLIQLASKGLEKRSELEVQLQGQVKVNYLLSSHTFDFSESRSVKSPLR